MGQRVHLGRARVHTVAPKSMMACVYEATSRAGVQASDCAHNASITGLLLGSPSMPNTRASTRLTLPSRIG